MSSTLLLCKETRCLRQKRRGGIVITYENNFSLDHIRRCRSNWMRNVMRKEKQVDRKMRRRKAATRPIKPNVSLDFACCYIICARFLRCFCVRYRIPFVGFLRLRVSVVCCLKISHSFECFSCFRCSPSFSGTEQREKRENGGTMTRQMWSRVKSLWDF